MYTTRITLLIFLWVFGSSCNFYTPYYLEKQHKRLAILEAEYAEKKAYADSLAKGTREDGSLQKKRKADAAVMGLAIRISWLKERMANPDKRFEDEEERN